MKINKLLQLIVCLIIGFIVIQTSPVIAQTTNNSPYSLFGIGEMIPQNNLRNSSMGGISQGVRNPGTINPANPASYSSFDSLSFLFDIGVNGSVDILRSNAESTTNVSGSINYISFGFPILKFWRMSFGLNPLSAVGYDISDKREELLLNTARTYWADGATSKAYFGNSFKLSDNFHIGLNINYLFGNIDQYRMLYFPDSSYMRNVQILNTTYLHNFTYKIGVQYVTDIKSKYRLTIGATYGMQQTIKASMDNLVTSMLLGYDDDSEASDIDTISYVTTTKNMTFPMDLSFGFTLEKPGNFVLGADISWTNWSNYLIDGTSQELSDLWVFNVGGEYIPSHLSMSKYRSRIAYRFGFRTRQKLHVVNNTNINEYAITAGIGLPLLRSKTKINIHAEAGWLGTTQNNLVQKTFFKIGVGVSLVEMWFVKRKYL